MPSSLLGAAEAAGGKRRRTRARGTWARPHPRLRWTPRPNGWTLNGTVAKRQSKGTKGPSSSRTLKRNPPHLDREGSPRYLGAGDLGAGPAGNPPPGDASLLVRVGVVALALLRRMTRTLPHAEVLPEADVVPGEPIHTVS